MHLLILLICVLLFAILIGVIVERTRTMRYDDFYDDDEEEIVTTTTTTTTTQDNTSEHNFIVVGTIHAKQEGNQWYVIDPVDNEKIWVNANDDFYRDADGKVWDLQ